MTANTFTVELVAIDTLQPDPDNPRTMPATEMAALEASLAEFGFVEPVVARRSDRRVIGGHQRLGAARRLGWTEIPVIWWEGDERAARALNLALNQIHGAWDESKLAQVLAELADVESLGEALAGFDQTWTGVAGFDAAEVLAALDGQLGDDAPREDLAALARALVPAPKPPSSTRLGDGSQLGAHRVLCGDATDEGTVRRLCAGAPPALLFTDPPYGVAYRPEPAPGGAASSGRPRGRQARPLGAIAGDDLDDTAHAALITDAITNGTMVLAAGAAVYVCGGTTTTTVYDAAFAAAGVHKSTIIVWDKGRATFGRKDYQSQHELLWYGWRTGSAHRFLGGRTQTDIWAVPPDAATTLRPPHPEARGAGGAGDPQQHPSRRGRAGPLWRLRFHADRRRADRPARLPARNRSALRRCHRGALGGLHGQAGAAADGRLRR